MRNVKFLPKANLSFTDQIELVNEILCGLSALVFNYSVRNLYVVLQLNKFSILGLRKNHRIQQTKNCIQPRINENWIMQV